MARKTKAECSPEEWAVIQEKNRQRGKERYDRLKATAEGRDYLTARSQRHYQAVKGDDERLSRKREADKRHYYATRDDEERLAIYRMRHRIAERRRMADEEYRARANARYNESRREKRAEAAALRPKRTKAVKAPEPRRVPGEELVHIRRAVMSDQMYREVMAAIPSKYHLNTREDIATEALLLWLDGTATDAADAVKQGMRTYFKMFNQFGTVSLDETFGDGDLRRIDTLSSDHMDDYW